jgi:hypothetical protein
LRHNSGYGSSSVKPSERSDDKTTKKRSVVIAWKVLTL